MLEAMTNRRSHSAGFERQNGEAFIALEALHALAQRHNMAAATIPYRGRRLSREAASDDERGEKQHKEDHKKRLGDAARHRCDPAETEHASDDGDHKEK